MAELVPVLLLVTLTVPLLVAGVLSFRQADGWSRTLGVVAAVTVVVSSGLAGLLSAEETLVAWPATRPIWHVAGLSAPLLPFAGLIWGATLLASPRSTLGRLSVRRSALGIATLLGAFSTDDPIALAVFWTAGIIVLLRELKPYRRASRVATVYLGSSSVAFVVGAGLLAAASPDGALAWIGGALVLVAAMIRKGIVPFHSWLPEVFERGPLAPSLLFSTPQLGAWATAAVLLRYAPAPLLTALTVLALLTSVYGAMVATVQTDVRRAFAWFFVSQSALVMAGLDSASPVGIAGGLAIWISSGLALTGLGLAVLVLEARRGRLSLGELHGGFSRMPVLASSFLLMGLASVGFPGTLGFVGEELLVDGAVEQFPVIGFAVVLATALNGIAMLRMYFSLFTGRRDAAPVTTLLLRERVVFATLAAILLIGGLALPRPFVASREAAAETLLKARLRGAPEAPHGR